MKLQKVLITGGSRGIGKELVNLYSKQGCEVHIVARNFKEEINSPYLKFHSFDLSQADKINDFAKAFINDNGVPDLLINNAGAGAFFEWEFFPQRGDSKTDRLTFHNTCYIVSYFAPEMAKAKKGKL